MASPGHGSEQSRQAQDIRLVVDTIPALAWSARPDGSAEFFSRRWLQYAGLSEEEARNWGWTVAVHPDDRSRLTDYWRSVLASGEQGEIEGRLRRFDGEYRWFLFSANPLRDESGKIVNWYGTNTDIDDRKQAEDALRASEQSFRTILDGIAGLVAVMTAEGEVERVNRQVLDYLGKTAEQLKGWSASDAVHPDDLPNVVSAWRHSVETVGPYDLDHRLRRADGVYRWFRARGLPLRDVEGRIARWHVLLTDIDERKQADEKLRRSEWNLHEAQRLGHSGSWSLDASSGNVTTSPEMFRAFDVKPDDDCSSPDFWFNRIHPEDRKWVRNLFERCVIEKIRYEADYRLLLPDGTIKYQHSIGRPILNEAGELVEFVGTAMDVTEQVLAKADLEKALAENKLLRDQLYKENFALREEIDRSSMHEEIVGSSERLRMMLSQVDKVAKTDSTVLILGETGTGKELIASAIHKRSKRSTRAFIRVNCAAIPPSLIASELFGHEKGAFTGALQRRLGRFESADGGTIFLDEIGELPPETQIAMLRVLQEREIERVGSGKPISIDVRVLAATNRDLEAAMVAGTFRQDLFYRLNVFPIRIPSLRERKDDIPLLVEYLVERYAKRAGKRVSHIKKKTLDLFQSYDWPGNIRELQNVIERAVILCDGETFSVDETWLRRKSDQSSGPVISRTGILAKDKGDFIERERRVIEAALAECHGKISGPSGAAAKLGVPHQTLESKIASLHIDKRQFKARSSKQRPA
jgi:PAS domain S-box-containing protein